MIDAWPFHTVEPLYQRLEDEAITTGGTAVLTHPPDTDEELDTGHDDTDYSGWFCLATDPWPCPQDGCDFVALHMTAAHMILVWPQKDDPELLFHAKRGMEVGRNPKVVEYEQDFGPCMSYYEWMANGRRVHGIRRTNG